MQRRWLNEVETAKGLAILGVLIIHLSGRPLAVIAKETMAFKGYLLLNTLMQFSVPMFIFLSALLLSYNLKDKPLDLKQFYLKRARQVALPYLTWTIIYLIYRIVIGQNLDFNLTNLAGWFLLGKAQFHLYFLSVILQMYLVFPLILKFYRLQEWSFPIWMMGAFGLQIGFYWINRLYVYQYIPYPASLVYWHLFSILAGVWFGSNYNIGLWSKYKYHLVALALAGFGVYGLTVYNLNLGKAINTFYYHLEWQIYVLAASILLLLVANQLKSYAGALISLLGRHSFGIYLSHIIFLDAWKKLYETAGFSIHIYFLIGLIVVGSLALGFTIMVQQTPLNIPLLGGTRARKN